MCLDLSLVMGQNSTKQKAIVLQFDYKMMTLLYNHSYLHTW